MIYKLQRTSRSELITLLYQIVYIFIVLELEKTIKMTHICPTLTLSPGSLRNIIKTIGHSRVTGTERTAWDLKDTYGKYILAGKST
jgi:hypothetical protein